jgi:hypothetical protein
MPLSPGENERTLSENELKTGIQYKLEQVATSFEVQNACKTLNRYGVDGWEAVLVWSDGAKPQITYALFKRSLPRIFSRSAIPSSVGST